jgi:type II secretory pathway pseudopilin PulG
MRILVHHQGQQLGPFSVEELRAALAAGRISAQDLAWWEGAPAWVPVTAVPGLGVVSAPGAASVVTSSGDGSALAVWSLILGIPSIFLCGFFSGIPAVICGHIALARKASAGVAKGRGIAIAGLVTGYLGTIVGTIGIIAALAIPIYGGAMAKARSTMTMTHARVVMVSLNVYAIQQGEYPQALQELVEKNGLRAEMLSDPVAPQYGNDGFTYIRPTRDDADDKVVLISRGAMTGGKRVVARKDGNVKVENYSLPVDL